MKILFIVPHSKGKAPSQRLKFEEYLDIFSANGIEYDFCPFFPAHFFETLYKEGRYFSKVFFTFLGYVRRFFDILKSIRYDMVFLHIEAAPFGPPVFEYLLKILGKPIIYDIDDNIYLAHSSKANRFVEKLKCSWKVPSIIIISSLVSVSTKYIQEYALKYNRNVIVIPPTVDTDIYRRCKKKRKEDIVCVGWTGSYSTSEYLNLIAGPLKEIAKRFNIRIKLIGSKDFSIPGTKIDSQPWHLETEVEDLSEIDIGLYPLPKEKWVLGKGGGKVFQYMALGIPPVCSPVGTSLEIVKDGVNGFFADSKDEWIEKISLLIENSLLREKMGKEGRKTVEERYSVKAYTNTYLDLIRNIR